MRETTFFNRLLNLEYPWKVEVVNPHPQDEEIELFLDHWNTARFQCPECGRAFPLYDHTPLRTWRHLDIGQCRTWLHARLPRVSCPIHGVRRVPVPWALPEARFTKNFECHAIDTLLEADVTGATRLLEVSWDEAWNFLERAVQRGQQAKRKRVVRYLGVDEKAIAKRHRYVTLVSDLENGTVEYIAKDRKKTSLDAYYQSLSARQKSGILGVAMDMWDPFIASTKEHLQDAEEKIVFDRYHVMAHMNKAVNQVRKEEHRQLMAQGDERLKGTRFWWLFAEDNIPENYREAFEELKETDLKTADAWAIKESLRRLWGYQRSGWARKYWEWWNEWARESGMEPVIKVAKMIENYLPNVLTYCRHRITNAMSEGLNSKIQEIKKTLVDFETGSIIGRPFFFIAEDYSCIQGEKTSMKEDKKNGRL